MENIIELHPSNIGLLLSCGQSHKAAIRIDEDSDPARLGRAVHKCLMYQMTEGHCDYQKVTDEYGCDIDEMERLVKTGQYLYNEIISLRVEFTHYELMMQSKLANGIVLKGTCDVLGLTDDRTAAIIVDYKTNRQPDRNDYYPQLRAYAALVFENYPTVSQIKIVLLWLREGTYSAETIDRGSIEMNEFISKVITAVREQNPAYSPGDHCQYCKRFYGCDGRLEKSRGALATLSGTNLPVAPEQLRDMLLMRRQINKALEAFSQHVREQILLNGGKILLPDGKCITFRDKQMPNIDAGKAWCIMTKHLSQDEFAPAVKLKKKELDGAIRAKVKRGYKKEASDAFFKELEDAGAITFTTQQEIVIQENNHGE